jgi:hypothetical protein
VDDSGSSFDEVPKHAVWVRYSGNNDGVRLPCVKVTRKTLIQEVCEEMAAEKQAQ